MVILSHSVQCLIQGEFWHFFILVNFLGKISPNSDKYDIPVSFWVIWCNVPSKPSFSIFPFLSTFWVKLAQISTNITVQGHLGSFGAMLDPRQVLGFFHFGQYLGKIGPIIDKYHIPRSCWVTLSDLENSTSRSHYLETIWYWQKIIIWLEHCWGTEFAGPSADKLRTRAFSTMSS